MIHGGAGPMLRARTSAVLRGCAVLLSGAACSATEVDTGTMTGTTGPADTTMIAESSTGAADTTTGTTSSTGPADESSDDAPPTDLPLPPEPKSCALEVIDPEADPTMVIDAGDGVGQIPTLVGEVLLRNCGCHYNVNMLMPGSGYIDYISETQPLATLADFHGNFLGTFPTGYEEMPAYLAVERRVVFSDPLPMPPFGCGAENEDAKISAADLALLTDWLAAAAPDGATFPGR